MNRATRFFLRVLVLLGTALLTALLFLFASGCTSIPSPRVVLVFVDISASVKDFAAYRDAFSRVVSNLHPGDRVILAQISDCTYTGFRPLLDYEIPRFSYWRDNKLVFEKDREALKVQFGAALDSSLSVPRSQKTDIFGALLESGKVFKNVRRERVLVLLSDMLEDSDGTNFETLAITDTFTNRFLADAKREGSLPDLSSATVYVAGASARSTRKASEVEKFWAAYFKAANARLNPEHYGSALLNFGE